MAKEGPHIHVLHVLQMAERQSCMASSTPAFPSDPDSISTISIWFGASWSHSPSQATVKTLLFKVCYRHAVWGLLKS